MINELINDAVTSTSVLLFEPDGFYGIVTLRAPAFHDASGDSIPVAAQPDWDRWLPRLLGCASTNAITCHSGIVAFTCPGEHGSNGAPHNFYAERMLKTLTSNGVPDIYGPIAMLALQWPATEVTGLSPDQMSTAAAAYRTASRLLRGKKVTQ